MGLSLFFANHYHSKTTLVTMCKCANDDRNGYNFWDLYSSVFKLNYKQVSGLYCNFSNNISSMVFTDCFNAHDA